jgi:hypothetical protein
MTPEDVFGGFGALLRQGRQEYHIFEQRSQRRTGLPTGLTSAVYLPSFGEETGCCARPDRNGHPPSLSGSKTLR